MNEDALAQLRRDHVGIVFQAFRLIPSMTAVQNVAVPLELASDSQASEKAEKTLKSLGLGHRLHHLPDQLSGGEQQRVAIARAIVTRPEYSAGRRADRQSGQRHRGSCYKRAVRGGSIGECRAGSNHP